MIEMNHSRIAIAGMGRTGKSVANYLTTVGVAFDCCDNGEIYPDCNQLLENYDGYVVKSPGIPGSKLPTTVADSIINDIELFLRLSRKPVIMVTGTNGKSTVVSLLEHIFKACGVSALACGNNGVPVMDAYAENPAVYILELSSYQLENISSLTCVSSVVLNIGIDHVDRYLDMDDYESVKQKIYSSSGLAVYPIRENGEISYRDEIQGYISGATQGVNIYSILEDNIVRNDEIFCRVADIGLIGRHNYLNVCAALSLIEVFDLEKGRLLDALKTYTGLPHRMELVCKDAQGRAWINDSKSTNVHSLVAALSSQATAVCLIAGGRGKGEDYTQVFAAYKDVVGVLIAYGEEAEVICMQASQLQKKFVVHSVADAVELATEHDLDVIFSPACASFDQYQDFNVRGDDFRQQVRRVTAC